MQSSIIKTETASLEVSEIFASIQGEGKFIGRPSLFLRLRRCNLSCEKCDERHTWDKNDPGYYVFNDISAHDLISRIHEEIGVYNLVITGGEPLIWQRQLSSVLEGLSSRFSVEVETNGTIIPKFEHIIHPRVHFNISPKLPSFHDDSRKTLRRENLIWFANRVRKGQGIFKFVVSYERDVLVINKLVERYEIPNSQVYLMPEGRTAIEVQNRLPMLFDLCREHSYNLSPRLHILAFNNQKGT